MRRQVIDGVLLKLIISIFGQPVIALVDSGASRCYMLPEVVTSLGLQTSLALVHLELVDGSRIRSTQQVQAVRCGLGNFVCTMNFTVTKLLYQVDLVLGKDWLEHWNLVIDLEKQTVNIWTRLQWECLQGLLLDGTYTAGTVKLF